MEESAVAAVEATTASSLRSGAHISPRRLSPDRRRDITLAVRVSLFLFLQWHAGTMPGGRNGGQTDAWTHSSLATMGRPTIPLPPCTTTSSLSTSLVWGHHPPPSPSPTSTRHPSTFPQGGGSIDRPRSSWYCRPFRTGLRLFQRDTTHDESDEIDVTDGAINDGQTSMPAPATSTPPATTSTPTTVATNGSKFQQRNQRWVVLVDDEEAIRLAVGDFLYDAGYQVTACVDADSMLELLSSSDGDGLDGNVRPSDYVATIGGTGQLPDGKPRHRQLPDAIISDIRMPGSSKNGYELVETIRADTRLSKIPIVMLTAKAMTQDRIRGYRSGADVFLPKPFAPEELLSILDNLIERKEQRTTGATGAAAAAAGPSSTSDPSNNDSAVPDVSELMALKQELEDIKEIMKRNAATTVRKTNVSLTDAERRVLELVCEGYTNPEIAFERGVGVVTVNRMVQKLYEETNTRSRTELVKWAITTGYVPP